MYTGIVQALVPVLELLDHPTHRSIFLALAEPQRIGLELGASVAVNGVCLTVADLREHAVQFDVIPETLARTNLGNVIVGEYVNIERSAKIGDENGGHDVSGHVDGTALIVAIDRNQGRYAPRFEVPARFAAYLFDKGFVALDGASLTVCDVDRKAGQFSVHLIPETLRRTRIGKLDVGGRVNFEVERRTQVIVDTVRALIRDQPELLRSPDPDDERQGFDRK